MVGQLWSGARTVSGSPRAGCESCEAGWARQLLKMLLSLSQSLSAPGNRTDHLVLRRVELSHVRHLQMRSGRHLVTTTSRTGLGLQCGAHIPRQRTDSNESTATDRSQTTSKRLWVVAVGTIAGGGNQALGWNSIRVGLVRTVEMAGSHFFCISSCESPSNSWGKTSHAAVSCRK